MNQYVTFNFATVKNDRVYQMVIQPGSPWDDLEEVIKEFQEEFLKLKEEAQNKEESKAAPSEEVVEPEIVEGA